ncbi:MAG: ferredoxin family protein [Syntrophorhabdales bacterium]
MVGKASLGSNPTMPGKAIVIDPQLCTGCLQCPEVCRIDVMIPKSEERKSPIVLYPDECWSCGCCVLECNRPAAMTLLHPLNQSLLVAWKRKQTGENFRLGMKNLRSQTRGRRRLRDHRAKGQSL